MDSKERLKRIAVIKQLIAKQSAYIQYLEDQPHVPASEWAAAYADLDDMEEDLDQLMGDDAIASV